MASKKEGGADPADDVGLTALERLEELAVDYAIDTHSMVSDLRDAQLEIFKHRPKPWGAMTEDEQRAVADALEHSAKELVRRAVEAIAARGKKPVRVLLTKISMGDGIVVTGKVKALGEVETDEAVMTLHHSRNKIVMLTVADVSDFTRENPDADIDADQPDLDFEAGGDDFDEFAD